jgi:hypothetical protein
MQRSKNREKYAENKNQEIEKWEKGCSVITLLQSELKAITIASDRNTIEIDKQI